jgi:hypothetical protein
VSGVAPHVGPADEEWGSFSIPASSGPVGLRLLHHDPDGGLCLLVRFPAGWERPGPGSYDVPEEVLFLAGELEMGGVRYGAGDYAWLPGFGPRGVTRTDCGALAAAWFSGPNRWTEGPPARQPDSETVNAAWTSVSPGPTPLAGVQGRLLRDEGARAAWVVEGIPRGTVVPPQVSHVQVLDMATLRSWIAPTGAEIPEVSVGPAWLRVASRV